MVYLNGQLNDQISIRDRGLAYGDGLFETIAIINNKAHNWNLHWQRLSQSAKFLGINLVDETEFINIKNKICKQLQQDKFILKIIVTRGEGGKGYQTPENQYSQWIVLSNPWPNYPLHYYEQGVDVQQLDFKLSVQPTLSQHKHLNRLEQVYAKQQLAEKYQEGLLCNTLDHVIEGISSNLYFVKNNVLCIPELTNTGVKGTVRSQVIELCKENNITFIISDYKIEDIMVSQEVFLSNSIIGLWPVRSLTLINGQIIDYRVGNIYLYLSKKINQQLGVGVKIS